jgi:Holliday junction resolvasome RuvABC endonuclease subunit
MPKHKILRDPDNLHGQIDLKKPSPEVKLALGLDLGTISGIAGAWFDPDRPWIPGERPVYLGQLDLSLGDYDSGVTRFIRLNRFLKAFDPDIVFFEDVIFVGTNETYHGAVSMTAIIARAARPIELFGSFKATVGTYCEERNVPCKGFTIQAIKKRATGKGNANKAMVIEAANEEFGAGLQVEDYDKLGTDNIADALFCLALGLEQYGRGVPSAAEDDREGRVVIRKRPAAARKVE